METHQTPNARRFVLYSQGHDDNFVCVMEEWDGKRYVESKIRQSNERALYAFIDCKREAILHNLWNEKSINTPPRAKRNGSHGLSPESTITGSTTAAVRS